jgi:hypothetical protein
MIFIPGKEGFVSATDLLINEAHTYLSELQLQRLIPSHLEEYMELAEALKDYRKVFYGLKFATDPTDTFFTVRGVVTSGKWHRRPRADRRKLSQERQKSHFGPQ